MGERYIVDERVGCIAVVDTTLQGDEQGLHDDSKAVVWYRHGQQDKGKCPTCGQTTSKGWFLPGSIITEAYAECARLNAEDEKQLDEAIEIADHELRRLLTPGSVLSKTLDIVLAAAKKCANIGDDIDKMSDNQIETLRRELFSVKKSAYFEAECMAALAFMILDDDGDIPPDLLGEHPAFDKALRQLQNRHAWVLLGPVKGGKGQFLEKFGRADKKESDW